MYTAHFGLNAVPFSLTPDPRYLYLSETHREALDYLLQGVHQGMGFVLLTGEVGTGKTTLCRSLVGKLAETVDIAILSQPCLTPQELMVAIFDALRLSYEEEYTLTDYLNVLKNYLLTARRVERNTVLILDEAQNLSLEVLEQVRLLTNLETDEHKLLQIILVGQPELKKMLKTRKLRQVAQRITARYHLSALSYREMQAYINHRLSISGGKQALFQPSALRAVYRHTKGIPRLINVICDRALLDTYVAHKEVVEANIVHRAVQEVQGETVSRYSPLRWVTVMLTVLLITVAILWWFTYPVHTSRYQEIDSPIQTKIIRSDDSPDQQSTGNSALPTLTDDTQNAQNTAEPTETEDAAVGSEIIIVGEEDLPAQGSLEVNVKESENTSQANEPNEPEEITLLSLLKRPDIASDTQSAFITLFSLWELDYASLEGETACERALTKGLACLYKTGNWEDLRRFNQPAVIELVTNVGTQHYVVVSDLDKETATLSFLEEKYTFPLEKIKRHWLGQFLLLWRPPSLPTPVLRSGVTHDDVRWVRKRLNIAEGRTFNEENLSARFDGDLRQRVIAFQRKHNLAVDGIVGEKTMLLLHALDGEKPTL